MHKVILITICLTFLSACGSTDPEVSPAVPTNTELVENAELLKQLCGVIL